MKIHRSGFTFVELLLALGIFSIVAVTIAGTFAAGIKIHRRATNVNFEERDARLILDLLTQDLENAVYYNFENSSPEKNAFEGDANQIRFLTATSAGLKVVRYSLVTLEKARVHQTLVGKHFSKLKSVLVFLRKDEEEGLVLLREEMNFADLFQTNPSTEQDVLTKFMKKDGLKFSFLYKEGNLESSPLVWLDTWKEKGIPLGVKVQMSFVEREKDKQAYQISQRVYIPTGSLPVRSP